MNNDFFLIKRLWQLRCSPWNMTKNKHVAEQAEDAQRLEAWLEREDPLIIMTHQQVDADAAFSAALLHILRPNAAVVFAHADAEVNQPEVIAVDMMNGTSSVKGLGVGSAFGLVVQSMKNDDPLAYKALKRWGEQLNMTDSGKGCSDKVVLAELVSAWRMVGFDDQVIVERARELLQGKIDGAYRQTEMKKVAKTISIEACGLAVVGPQHHVTSKQLFARGAKVVVREGKSGIAIVLSKKLQREGFSLKDLEARLPKRWFIHPAGFLAAFGGPKAPKDPSKAGITRKQAAKLVRSWLSGKLNVRR